MYKKKLNAKYEEFHKSSIPQHYLIKKNNFTYRIILEVVDNWIGLRKEILDIGCGVGTLAFYLASKGNKVRGVDISEKAITTCKESAKSLNLHTLTSFKVMNFPKEIPRGKFDFILCSEVIEHLKDDNLAIKKIYFLLKPGGIAIISTPSVNAPLYRFGLAKEFDEKVGHLRRYLVEDLVNMAQKCNFKVLQTRKTEGILRNFLFINPIAGKFVRFIKFYISDLVTIIDNSLIKLFGESQIFIVLQKT